MEDGRYFLLAALAGVLAGLAGSAFHLAIDQLIGWPALLAARLDGWELMLAAGLVCMCCTLMAVAAVRIFAPEAGGSGVQEIEGAMAGLRTVHWLRVLPVKFSMGIVALSSCLALGREGPTIHIGASMSAAITRFFKVSDVERRAMLAAGAAAGLSCAFNAPLASILFIIEETRDQFPYSFRSYVGVIIAVVMSTIVTRAISGSDPMMPLHVPPQDLAVLGGYLLLGLGLGLAGMGLNAAILRMLEFADLAHARIPYLYPACIGLGVGVLAVTLPASVTGGEQVIEQIATRNLDLQLLLVLAGLRCLTLVGSYSTGVPGGVFAPMLTLAMCLGLAFGVVGQMLLPDAGLMPVAFGMAAMGGLFAGSIRSPVVGVVLTVELTGSYEMILPLIVTCAAAHAIAKLAGGRPLYEMLLERTLRKAQATACVPEREGGL